MIVETPENTIRRLLAQLQEDPGGRLQLDVPHGFETVAVETSTIPNPLMPDLPALAEHETTAQLSVPVIWKIDQGRWPTQASDEPDPDNVHALKAILTHVLKSGQYPELRGVELIDWSAELPPGPHPAPDAAWTVRAVIRSI